MEPIQNLKRRKDTIKILIKNPNKYTETMIGLSQCFQPLHNRHHWIFICCIN